MREQMLMMGADAVRDGWCWLYYHCYYYNCYCLFCFCWQNVWSQTRQWNSSSSSLWATSTSWAELSWAERNADAHNSRNKLLMQITEWIEIILREMNNFILSRIVISTVRHLPYSLVVHHHLFFYLFFADRFKSRFSITHTYCVQWAVDAHSSHCTNLCCRSAISLWLRTVYWTQAFLFKCLWTCFITTSHRRYQKLQAWIFFSQKLPCHSHHHN